MTNKLGVAVIGCGSISANHIKAYANHDSVELKYLVDVDKERALEMAQTYGVDQIESDYKKILEDPEVEAVSVCTPNDTHAPVSIDCLNAAKHVLCEKPAAMNMEQVRAMQEAAKRNERILSIGVVNRYNTAVNKIKEMVQNGELGDIYHVYCSFRAHRSIPGLGGPFTTKEKAGGGVLIDWGVHFLDLIFYCLEEPNIQTVSGATHCQLGKHMQDYAFIKMWAGPPNYDGTYNVEDFVTGLIRTDGPTINLNGAWAQNIGESAMFIEFLGNKAGVKLQYGGNFTIYSAENGTLYETTPSYQSENMFEAEINGFVEAAQTNTKNRSHIDHVMVTSEVMEAIYTSAAQGKEVDLCKSE